MRASLVMVPCIPCASSLTIVLGEAVSLLCTAAAASMSPRSVMASSVTSSGLQPLTACESSCRKEAATAS